VDPELEILDPNSGPDPELDLNVKDNHPNNSNFIIATSEFCAFYLKSMLQMPGKDIYTSKSFVE
jgi:hypothetical protein